MTTTPSWAGVVCSADALAFAGGDVGEVDLEGDEGEAGVLEVAAALLR